MLVKTLFFFQRNAFTLLIALWISLNFFPWAVWLKGLPWIQLGVAIFIFTVPGMMISLLLVGKKLTLSSHFTSGIAISIFWVGLLGLIGRLFNLSFEFIKPVFALSGLVVLFILKKHSQSEHQLYKPKNFSIVTLVLLLSMIIFGITVSFLYRFDSDDFSYLVYLTNWQHAQPLNFQELIFNTGAQDTIRFWLAMFPMNQAFLAEISHIHGLWLLGFYLEPFLVVIAIIAVYNLYEDLFESEHFAIAALLLQFTFLVLRASTLYTGIIFFNRLSHDKAFAAFVLAPVFFLAVRCFLDSPRVRNGIFVLLIGLSLTLTHPVILAFSIFIASVYAGIVTITQKDYKKLVVILLLLMVIVSPAASTRIIQLPWLARYIPALATMNTKGVFDLESALDTRDIELRISHIAGTPFYGFNLNVIRVNTRILGNANPLEFFFSWSYLWILGLGFVWSVFNLKKNGMAPFIAATSLLVLLSAIPYTGWLVGYFVSARLLIRSSWMLPVGLIGAVLMIEFFKYMLYKILPTFQTKFSLEQIVFGTILTISLVSISVIYGIHIFKGGWKELTRPKLDIYQADLTNFVTLGNYLENNFQSPAIFAAPTALMNYLPGLSSKSKVVFFRVPQFSLYPVDIEQINFLFLQEKSISFEQRTDILRQYNIQYIVVNSISIKDYYAQYPEFFTIQNAGRFWILKFLPAGL